MSVSLGRGGRFRHWYSFFFFQAEDGIRDLVRSRGLGDVYKRQMITRWPDLRPEMVDSAGKLLQRIQIFVNGRNIIYCLLYTSDAADE